MSSSILKQENAMFSKYKNFMRATYILLGFVWLNSAQLYISKLPIPSETLSYVLQITRIVLIILLSIIAFGVAIAGVDKQWLMNFKIVLLILYVIVSFALYRIRDANEIMIKG